jgi:hypothetical protein
VERILHNMSLLMERSFSTASELNRYRKELAQSLAAKAEGLVLAPNSSIITPRTA